MNAGACSWRTITALILVECLSAIIAPAAFSPAPPKAASTPTLSNALTIASYTRIGRALPSPPRNIATARPSAFGRWGRDYRSLGKIQLQIEAAPNCASARGIRLQRQNGAADCSTSGRSLTSYKAPWPRSATTGDRRQNSRKSGGAIPLFSVLVRRAGHPDAPRRMCTPASGAGHADRGFSGPGKRLQSFLPRALAGAGG